MKADRFNKLLVKSRYRETGLSAMTEIYVFYYPKIVLHIYRKYGDKNFAEDIAQDFFVKLLGMKFKDEIKNPLAWILTVSNNIARDFFEKERRRKMAFEWQESNKTDEVFDKVIYGEYLDALKKLDPETQEIIMMRIYEKRSFQEIASDLGLKYEAVKQKYLRGKIKLREIFKLMLSLLLIFYVIMSIKLVAQNNLSFFQKSCP